jgi:hypothetical protein
VIEAEAAEIIRAEIAETAQRDLAGKSSQLEGEADFVSTLREARPMKSMNTHGRHRMTTADFGYGWFCPE